MTRLSILADFEVKFTRLANGEFAVEGHFVAFFHFLLKLARTAKRERERDDSRRIPVNCRLRCFTSANIIKDASFIFICRLIANFYMGARDSRNMEQ